MKLLHIDSSIVGEASTSRRLSAAIVGEFRRAVPNITIIRRDLCADPIPHLDASSLPEVRAANAPDAAAGDGVLEEFLHTDIAVIGAPMYNFGIPSQLKAWIDRLAVAGKTFRYTEKGPLGLAGGKRVIVASSRGGFYGAGSPLNAIDHQEKYLSAVFGFFGITDIRFVRAEGVNVSAEQRHKAIADAERNVVELLAA